MASNNPNQGQGQGLPPPPPPPLGPPPGPGAGAGAAPGPNNNILQRFAHAILTQAATRYNNYDVLFLILDLLDDQELISLMEADERFVPLIYMEYGAHHRWIGRVNILDSRGSLQLWHLHAARRRSRQQLRQNTNRAIDVLREGATGDLVQLEQRLRRLEEEELYERYTWLCHMRRSISTLQHQQLQVAAQPSAPEVILLNHASGTPASLEEAMRRCEGDIASVRDRIAANEPPPASPLAPVVALAGPPPGIVPEATANDNAFLGGLFYPLEEIIARDAINALRTLRRLGYFNPLGYTHRGYSLLHHAIEQGARRVVEFILLEYRSNTLLLQSTAPTDIVDARDASTIPAQLISYGMTDLFNQVWNGIVARDPRVDARPVFNDRARDMLCHRISKATADSLAQQGLDLRLHTNVTTPTQYTIRGTVWHMAIGNPNLDFLDFLAQNLNTLWRIDLPNSAPVPVTPLNIAVYSLASGPLIERLVQHGARTFSFARPLLYSLVDPSHLRLTFWFTAPGARLSTEPWIHRVLEGLEWSIRCTWEPRAMLVRRATRLIIMLRTGWAGQSASLTIQDYRGLTPLGYASRYGLTEVLYLLHPRQTPPTGRADGTSYHLRRRPRVNYPPSAPNKRRRKR